MNRENGVFGIYPWILIILLYLAGCAKQLEMYPEEVYGIVNKNVTLCPTMKDENNKPNVVEWIYKKVVTNKTNGAEGPPEKIAIIRNDNDGTLVFENQFKERVRVKNGTYLQITNLRIEDAGIYVVELGFNGVTKLIQQFNLSVSDTISSVTISTVCPSQQCIKNCYIKMTCSVLRGFPVDYIWTGPGNQDRLSEMRTINIPALFNHSNFNFTCMAKNVVSNDSYTVVPWNKCNPGKQETEIRSNRKHWSICIPFLLIFSCCIYYFCKGTPIRKSCAGV